MADADFEVAGEKDPANAPTITLAAQSDPYLVKVGEHYVKVKAKPGATDPWSHDPVGPDAARYDDGR
jgi:hypothetical protein